MSNQPSPLRLQNPAVAILLWQLSNARTARLSEDEAWKKASEILAAAGAEALAETEAEALADDEDRDPRPAIMFGFPYGGPQGQKSKSQEDLLQEEVLTNMQISPGGDMRRLYVPGMTISESDVVMEADPEYIKKTVLTHMHVSPGGDMRRFYVPGMTISESDVVMRDAILLNIK